MDTPFGQPARSTSWTARIPRGFLGVLAVAAIAVPGCFGGGGTPSNVAGTGKAKLYLEKVEWGRLVDVFDSSGVLVERDVMIRESMQSDGVNVQLGVNALTQSETLIILHDRSSDLFATQLRIAKSGMAAISTKGLDGRSPFTRVARNGSLKLTFSEYIDPATVDRQTIQVQVGDPPLRSQELRYIVKNNELGSDGRPKGVVILDPTISKFDQANLGIPENGVGYPASFDQVNPNVVLRIPTKLDPLFGQTQVLRNLGHTHTLAALASDPIELSPSFDPVVVRAFRSGNEDDPFNGFMIDRAKPKLVATQDATIASIGPDPGSANLRRVTYSIDPAGCRDITPKVGDLIASGSSILLVSQVVNPVNSAAYVVSGAVLSGDFDGIVTPAAGRITSAYSTADQQLQLCWLAFSPKPTTSLPADGLDPAATTISLQFDEAIDPVSVKSLESMVLVTYDPVDASGPARPYDPFSETVSDYIDRQIGFQTTGTGSGRIKFGPIGVSADSRTFTLSPSAGLTDSHNEYPNIHFALALRDGTDGVLDLAGNTLGFGQFVAGSPGQAHEFVLNSPPATDRYFALRFQSTDEDNDGLSEYSGQFVFNSAKGTLKGRDLNRFSRLADRSNQYVGQRIPFGFGIMTPLVPAGSVLQTIYGYHHLGLGLLAPSDLNLDVEGLNWSPFGGSVFDDTFPRFALALAHSLRFPDDYINPQSGYPTWPLSGLFREALFTRGVLGRDEGYFEEVVFDASTSINQVNVFQAASGSPMYPWPDFTDTYTWRDNAIPQSIDGAPQGAGVPPDVVLTANPALERVWTKDNVPSIGLPLLMWFKCYPRGNFFGSNGFQVQIMVGSSSLPAFRVFSAGGRDAADTWHTVVPDIPPDGEKPTGGYNTGTGERTKQYGPELYWGQVDFVVKISRVFTHWFAFSALDEPLDSISAVTMEPPLVRQPPGTDVIVEFRGTSSLVLDTCDKHMLTDSNCLDLYGDYEFVSVSECCGSIGSPTGWTADPSSFLSGPTPPKHFQLRFTFVANIVQNAEPELDAFGFAWNVQ
ncbi:MAG TPA: hypothetical protein VGC54_08480 [Planctomycetota bacterium]